MKEHSVTVT